MVNRRFAEHIGDDTSLLFHSSYSTDSGATRSILAILSDMPQDREILEWLRGQLLRMEGLPFRPEAAFRKWLRQEIVEWRLYDGDRPFER